MPSDKELIPAVAYIRKSGKGERTDRKGRRRERQERSPAQQREEILKHAEGRFRIIRWYEDLGVSGWKREAARPGFAKMLADACELRDFKAIIADDADRFSRASWRKAVRDVDDLADAGVEIISCVSAGDFRIGDEHDAGEAHRLLAVAMANHEYCRKLSRRVTLARRNAAEEGKRTGGPIPYGLDDDGDGGLKPGDPQKVEVVRRVFRQFTDELQSLRTIAGRLNAEKVPPPRGKAWYPRTLALLLRQPAYRGDFRFNRQRRGQFYGIDSEGDVVQKADLDGAGKTFVKQGAYEPLVDPDLWDRTQPRLATLSRPTTNPQARRRGRVNSGVSNRKDYPLTGVLVCDHCGTPMYGVRVLRNRDKDLRSPTVYKCNGNALCGKGTCKQYQVREADLLPFVLRLLGEEIADLTALLTSPPDEVRSACKQREAEQAQRRKHREQLVAQIDRAEENLLILTDSATLKNLERRVVTMRADLDAEVAKELAEAEAERRVTDDLEALNSWWQDFYGKAVQVPTRYHFDDPDDPDRERTIAVTADPKKVNQALHQIGCEVRLHFRAETYISMVYKDKDGKQQGGRPKQRYVLEGGRFRLGKQAGDLKGNVADTTAYRHASSPCDARRAGRRSRRTVPA